MTRSDLGGVVKERPGEAQDGGEAQRPPDDVFAGRLPIEAALQKLRLRLLDLTARNRLLNFKASAARTLQFVEGRLDFVFERLTESTERRIPVAPVPEPKRSEFLQGQGRPAR